VLWLKAAVGASRWVALADEYVILRLEELQVVLYRRCG
jgi:hypothetical protein